MKTNHTAGKWAYDGTDLILSEKEKVIADISPCNGYGEPIDVPESSSEREANAKLIAAAPELLEALQMLKDCFIHKEGDKRGNQVRSDIFKHCPEFAKACTNARYAIEKATN